MYFYCKMVYVYVIATLTFACTVVLQLYVDT